MAVVVAAAAAVEISAGAAVGTEEFSHTKNPKQLTPKITVGFFSISNHAYLLDIATSSVLGSSHQGQPNISK